jgi:hypothetical protein
MEAMAPGFDSLSKKPTVFSFKLKITLEKSPGLPSSYLYPNLPPF